MTRKGVSYSWEISQPDGNDEGTAISRYISLGAPESLFQYIEKWSAVDSNRELASNLKDHGKTATNCIIRVLAQPNAECIVDAP